MKAIFTFVLLVLLGIQSSFGRIIFSNINSPKDCPEELRVETQPPKDPRELVSVTVTLKKTEEGLYKDRVKAFGRLKVMAGDKVVASSNLDATEKAGVFTFKFELDRDAFRGSELSLSTQLYEADGMPTLGGGETYQIHLKGFQPE